MLILSCLNVRFIYSFILKQIKKNVHIVPVTLGLGFVSVEFTPKIYVFTPFHTVETKRP